MSTLPSVTIEQFRTAGIDLLDAVRTNGSLTNQPARVGVDLCLVISYPLQWLRDRGAGPIPDPGSPVFGVRGIDDDWDNVADVLQSIAQEVDGDNFANAIMQIPTANGIVLDYIIKAALQAIAEWLIQSGSENAFNDIIQWIIDQLS